MLALARHCPEFWASNELSRCCESGEWLHLEPDLVLQVRRGLKQKRSEVAMAVYSYIVCCGGDAKSMQ
jgi:hypothetical protein